MNKQLVIDRLRIHRKPVARIVIGPPCIHQEKLLDKFDRIPPMLGL